MSLTTFSFCSTNPQNHYNRCILSQCGQCNDHVSKFICNSHAKLFGLIYKRILTCTANNHTQSRIVTYIHTPVEFELPLFIDFENSITDMTEVQSYLAAMQAVHKFPDNIMTNIARSVSCLSGLDPINRDRCELTGWLSNEMSEIYLYAPQNNENNMGLAYKSMNLPLLHRMLLCYTKPSILVESESSTKVYIPNIGLTKRGGKYYITILNKDILLKYIGNERDYIASPLCLLGSEQNNNKANATRTFNRITPETC